MRRELLSKLNSVLSDNGYQDSYFCSLGQQERLSLCRLILTATEDKILTSRLKDISNSEIAASRGISRQAASKVYKLSLQKLGNSSDLHTVLPSELAFKLNSKGILSIADLKRISDFSGLGLTKAEIAQVGDFLGKSISSRPVDEDIFKKALHARVREHGGLRYFTAASFDAIYEYAISNVNIISRAPEIFSRTHALTDKAVDSFCNISPVDLRDDLTRNDKALLKEAGIFFNDEPFTDYHVHKLIGLDYKANLIDRLKRDLGSSYIGNSYTQDQIRVLRSFKKIVNSEFLYIKDPDSDVLCRILFRIVPDFVPLFEKGQALTKEQSKEIIERTKDLNAISVLANIEQANRMILAGITSVTDCIFISRQDAAEYFLLDSALIKTFRIQKSVDMTSVANLLPKIISACGRFEKECFYRINTTNNPKNYILTIQPASLSVGSVTIKGADAIYKFWKDVYLERKIDIKQVLSMAPIL